MFLFCMSKSGLIGYIVVVGVLLVVGVFWLVWEIGSDEEILESCVKASCCHASECVGISDAPDCSEVFCTMSCEPETMDCGQGHCEVVGGDCEVVWDE